MGYIEIELIVRSQKGRRSGRERKKRGTEKNGCGVEGRWGQKAADRDEMSSHVPYHSNMVGRGSRAVGGQ